MRKYYTSNDYKRRNTKRAESRLKQRLISEERKKGIRRGISGSEENEKPRKKLKVNKNWRRDSIKPIAYAPIDLRLIENPEKEHLIRNMDPLLRK